METNRFLKVAATGLISLMFTSLVGSSQHSDEGDTVYRHMSIEILNGKYLPSPDSGVLCQDSAFDALLKAYGVTGFEQSYSFARTERLRNFIHVYGESLDSLEQTILALPYVSDFASVTVGESRNIALYDPPDYHWLMTQGNPVSGPLWHLKKTQTNLAWDITKGSSDVIVGVIDTDFDRYHPDLQGKMLYNYDPFDNYQFNHGSINPHGTFVAGMAAAETKEIGQSPSGIYASAGLKIV